MARTFESIDLRVFFPGEVIPEPNPPFAALIDASDSSWRSARFVGDFVEKQVQAGCEYIICIGEQSEALHDLVDEVLLDKSLTEVITTFDRVASEEEAIFLLIEVVTSNIQGRYLFIENSEAWKREIERIDSEGFDEDENSPKYSC